jgi:transposase
MYSSDIRDKEWLILAPFIAQGKMGRPRTQDALTKVNAESIQLKVKIKK